MALSMFRKFGYLPRCVTSLSMGKHRPRQLCSKADSAPVQFDETMLQYLVCPLSKKPLRYDRETNELISDAIRVAYPIINGIPNLVPQDGRMMDGKTQVEVEET